MILTALLLACCLQAAPEVTVDTDSVTLGQILPFADGDARAAIAMGYAPQPGLGRRFSKVEFQSKIRAAGLSYEELTLPDSVLVRRKAEFLDPERVRVAVLGAFERQYPATQITVLSLNVPQTPLASGVLDLVATVPVRSDLTAPMFVRVDARGQGFSKSLFVRTVVEALIPQLVLVNPVAAGDQVHADDVELIPAPFKGLVSPLTSLEELQGVVASRDLRAGQTLTQELVHAPLLVRKGDSVTVTATSGGVTISATMRAKNDARFGDTISVEHLSGPGVTRARVIGSRSLEALQGVQ